MLKQLCINKSSSKHIGQTFTFLTCDHTETCPSHFQWSNLSFQTAGLHYKSLF
jgi:hypothetical protein